MTNVLGIHCGHNASAALFVDGKLAVSISEERLSRIKNHIAFPYRAVDLCLKLGALKAEEVTHVALSEAVFPWKFFKKPSAQIAVREAYHSARRHVRNALRSIIGKPPYPKERLVGPYDYERILSRLGVQSDYESNFLSDKFRQVFDFHNAIVKFYPHHLTHAYSAYHFSGWPDALVLTLDGGGFGICHSVNVPDGRGLKVLKQTSEETSPGFFYQDITVLLGFKALQHEGKVTGLAAYGDPNKLSAVFARCLRPSADLWGFENEFTATGARRKFLAEQIKGYSREDVSAAAQEILERAVVPHVREMARHSGRRKLALAGGVFANVKLNQHIAELPGIEEIFVTPPMGDEGLAWGAALAMMTETGNSQAPEFRRLDNVFLGPEYSEPECVAALKNAGMPFNRFPDPELFEKVAGWIAEGKVIGWYQGRMEFGPRALGNRSILVSPVDPRINNELNKRLSRSEFMPFAPSVLGDKAPDIFEGYHKAPYSSEFMTVTFQVKEAWKNRIPACVHVDGTARPQAVTPKSNPRYYALISAFEKKTGLPIVLNTSFNVHEEPIVCKPEEAVRALTEKRVDILVLGNLVSGG